MCNTLVHLLMSYLFFFFNDTATTEIYTLSLHDALPICRSPTPGSRATGGSRAAGAGRCARPRTGRAASRRSEEHTSELQSPCNLVCRLLLEKKNIPDRKDNNSSVLRFVS